MIKQLYWHLLKILHKPQPNGKDTTICCNLEKSLGFFLNFIKGKKGWDKTLRDQMVHICPHLTSATRHVVCGFLRFFSQHYSGFLWWILLWLIYNTKVQSPSRIIFNYYRKRNYNCTIMPSLEKLFLLTRCRHSDNHSWVVDYCWDWICSLGLKVNFEFCFWGCYGGSRKVWLLCPSTTAVAGLALHCMMHKTRCLTFFSFFFF